MNEPSNFPCPYPCDHPEATAKEAGFPPKPPPLRVPPRPLPGFPSEFQPPTSKSKREAIANVDGTVIEREYFELPRLTRSMSKRAAPGSSMGLPGRDLINPKYTIQNAAGSISNLTVDTDIVHENGYVEYDTHNLYGTSKLLRIL
jgi:alpha-glucosidase